ncbi:hypothetical protein [Pseudomonas qingdaonensis]|uniref:hypothetical protein n=1 Tax=Pseudomonas qingdaonensis TaxID=2056231 RepID=UPI0012FD1960|nr:hypothetical protein [Pseudomonas qingdaonensis]
MTDKQNTNDNLDNLDELFSGDFDFGDEPTDAQRNEAAFLSSCEARKKDMEYRLYLELEPVIFSVRRYCEESDRMNWFNYILPKFNTLNEYGNRRNTEIIYQLADLISDISYKYENDLNQQIPNKDLLHIKLFASFIIDIAAGKL